MTQEFNLQPDPRILPMLGEINLAQWRCLAELVDNSIDGFLHAERQGLAVPNPEIEITLPVQDTPSARVSIQDNGPGMKAEILEKAVSAGWSGNNPIDTLGMFGMGFNIATARLGGITTVWTSVEGDPEDHGLCIDFEELRRQRNFRVPHLTRPKADPLSHGTSVIIERLKPEQRAWLVKVNNRGQVKKELSRAYSAMLRPGGVPISFSLGLNGNKVPATNHCVWNEDRFVDNAKFGPVHAVQRIDQKLADRPFCVECWQWLAATDEVCPACGKDKDVVKRKRHVHGWIGVQRYQSETNYGIDFIRNGRKIEIGNRDLFSWRDPNTDLEELEYPIDDPRHRGRIVGEVHLDHARVTYMKDRFDRTDPAWADMIGIVRGEGPLQPQKAANLGYSNNTSPLYKLFQVFRRPAPHNARIAGGWASILAVQDNDRAEEMVRSFNDGDAAYQTDEKWWELIQAVDNALLTPVGPGTPPSGGSGATDDPEDAPSPAPLPGFSGGTPPTPPDPTPGPRRPVVPPPPPPREPLADLTRLYLHESTGMRWDVKAFNVRANDQALGGKKVPWNSRTLPEGATEVYLNLNHPIFRSATMTPLDGVLVELAHKTADYTRGMPNAPIFSTILADLRDRYAGHLKLDPVALANGATLLFRSIARTLPATLGPTDDAAQLFAEFPSTEQEAIQRKMAARGVLNSSQIISTGRFLGFATPRIVTEFVLRRPDLFFDGKCWDSVYSDIDYPYPSATQEARASLLRQYEAMLQDALWLADQDPADIGRATRERLLRAALAVELLEPAGNEGDSAEPGPTPEDAHE